MFYRQKKNNKYLYLFLAIVFFSLILITVTYKFSIDQYRFSYPFSRIFSEASIFFQSLYKNVVSYISIFTEYKKIKVQNQELKKSLSILINENNQLKEKLSYYKRWNKMLKYKERSSFKLIPANVIGREPSAWFQYIFIDKGKKDGIKKDMVVITYLGLVGKVKAVGPRTSKVMLILDAKSSLGGMIQRTRDIGVIEGLGKEYLKMIYINNLANIYKGDVVITSGLGGIYPKGIAVGYVFRIEKDLDKLYQKVYITPRVDFMHLEEVFIIKDKEEK